MYRLRNKILDKIFTYMNVDESLYHCQVSYYLRPEYLCELWMLVVIEEAEM